MDKIDIEHLLVELYDALEILNDIDSLDITPSERKDFHRSISAVVQDTIDVIKAHEPRVMTLDEVQKSQYVFLDTRHWVDGDYCGYAKHKDSEFSDCLTEFLDGYGYILSCDNSNYGEDWCCWTSRPTVSQLESNRKSGR